MQTNAQYFIISNLISPHVLSVVYHAMIAKVWTTPAYTLYFMTLLKQNLVNSIAPVNLMHLMEDEPATLYLIF